MNADEATSKILPDLQHKAKITLTWHDAVTNKADYLIYKKLFNTKKSSSYTKWLTSLFVVANLIKNDLKNQEIINKIESFESGGNLTEKDFLIIHNFLTVKLDELGILDLKIDKVSSAQKYGDMFK
jgi:hypothetical protein